MTEQTQQPWVAGVRELNACLPTLPQQEYLRLLKTVCGIRDLNAKLGINDQTKLALYEWLKHLGDVFGDDQRRKLIEQLDAAPSPLQAWGQHIFDWHQGGVQEALPTFVLALHDYRYATWPGQTEFWDVEFEEPVKELPETAVTVFICNVTALYVRLWTRLKNLRSRTDAGHQPSLPATLPPPAAPGQSPPSGGTRSGDAPRRGNLRDHVTTVVRGPLGKRKG